MKHNHVPLTTKPRLIDMDTGDIVDAGGDPYDFASDDEIPMFVDLGRGKSRTADAVA
jgi:hypothetical protein